VTVAAIDAVVTDVMFMTELNGLLSFDPLAGVPGGTIQLNSDPQQSNDYENRAVNRDFRQRVGAVMEDLWHLRVGRRSGVTSAHQPFDRSLFIANNVVLYQMEGEFQIRPQIRRIRDGLNTD
jgi:hypothetical protein